MVNLAPASTLKVPFKVYSRLESKVRLVEIVPFNSSSETGFVSMEVLSSFIQLETTRVKQANTNK
jgi:hypothetical protein